MPDGRLLDYPNVPRSIGAVVSSRIATLTELDTVYSVEDCYLLLDIISVDAHNQRIINKQD